jgi:hypothetical protein
VYLVELEAVGKKYRLRSGFGESRASESMPNRPFGVIYPRYLRTTDCETAHAAQPVMA